MFAIASLPSIHEKEEQKDVFLLKSSFATSPTILLSSPGSTYSGTHHRRRSSGISKQLMATTTSLDAAHQYQWAPAVNFPPSPSATPALSSRASSPESSPQSLATLPSLPAPSAPPSPSPSPPPYSVYANDVHQIPTLAASRQKQQQSGMPVGTRTTTTTLDGPPSRFSKHHQRPPIPLKPSALRLVSSSKTTVHSASTKGWRRFMHSGFTWIGLYFVFNMGLTLYNKTVLVHFPFPYSLTALHTLCGTIGCLWLRNTGYFTPARLTVRQNLTLAAFSVLYTLNIAVSNLSLQLVTVPFHQVVRASAPFFTILVAYLLSASRGKGLLGVGATKLLSLVPVIAGVGFATYGDYSFTAWGFILTLFGTFLAALKTVLTSILQTPSASSRLSTPLPVSTPVTAKPGYEYVLPPSPTSNSFSNGGNHHGNVTPPKSPYLSAHHQPQHRSSLSSSSSSSSSTAFDSASSSLAKHFAPLKRLLFKRFGFVSKRFDMDFGDMSHQTVVSTSIKLHPLDLLMRMSPLAFVQCVFYAWLSGELERAAVHKGPGLEGWSRKSATVLLLNGIIAFLLNIVSLTANQKNGPLTMTVAANVKQVLTILLAMYMFHLTITPANTIGIALTLAGGAWYGALEYEEKKNRLRMV